MHTKLIGLVAVLACAGAASAPAAATNHEPFAFGQVERGSLRVVSGAFVGSRAADLRGVWLDESVGCDQWRSLRVNVLVDYARGSVTRRVSRRRTGAVRNCAEGGPNFGFTIRAAPNGLACPNGRWKQGFYTFVVRTTHRASGLRALVSLGWSNTARC
jgi:hypothetical protein